MAAYSRAEIAEKIKRRMEAFFKANPPDTLRKNYPPYLKNELAKLVMDLMAEAWDQGAIHATLAAINDDPVPDIANPYVTEETP